MTFVVVGGGPTGVELAGAIGEIARTTMVHDFRRIDPRSAKILLVEGADRILTAYPPPLPQRAVRSLQRLGATTRINAQVIDIQPDHVTLRSGGLNGPTEQIATRTVLW